MKIKVVVFFGGRSVEHEISVLSALQAINAFQSDRYEITPVYITKQGQWYSGEALLDASGYKDVAALLCKCKKVYMKPQRDDFNIYTDGFWGTKKYATVDVALPVLHGTNGEDGIFQGLLELIGIPYVGCNVISSANGMDKITMKMILERSAVPVVDYVWFTDKSWGSDSREQLIEDMEKIGYPLIIKPANLGSSVGISRATSREELIIAVANAEKFSERILVEKMVQNLKEINCSVLGDCNNNQPSVTEEPLRSGEILSYNDKYLSGGKSSKGMQSTKRRMPADLPDTVNQKIQELAQRTFSVLSCNGVSRIDFLIDNDTNEVYVNEINTIPGSLSFYLWEHTGIKFSALMDKLIDLAVKRKAASELKTVSYSDNIFNMNVSSKGGKL